MSVLVLDQVLGFVRGAFDRKEVREVRAYGGEFSAAEVGAVGYTCPAIFVACLGWSPEASGRRLVGRRVRAVNMAAFIAFKHADRELRMRGAMVLAERLSLALSDWVPDAGYAPLQMTPVDEDPACENLYGRTMDAKGQALWMVRWTQDVKTQATPGQLADLLAIQIDEHYLPGQVPAAPPPAGVVPTLTDAINFQQPPQP